MLKIERFSLELAIGSEPICKSGEFSVYKCPLCGEPLLFVKDEHFTCFGCFKTGEIADFLAEKMHLSYKRAAWQALKNKPDESLYRLNSDVQKILSQNVSKTKYFERRGLTNAEIRRFGLGYFPGNFQLAEELRKIGYSDAMLERASIIKADESGKYFEPLRGRVIFPIVDENHRIVGFGGRILSADKTLAKYLNSSENEIFHKKDNLYGLNEAKGSETIYIVEGYMDVISMHKSGISNSVAALGTAVGERHCSLLKSLGVKKIILSLDGDEAGVKAAIRSVAMLMKYFEVGVLQITGAKDPDEFLQKKSSADFQQLPIIPGEVFLLRHSEDKKKDCIDILFNRL